MAVVNLGMAITASMPMMAMTIISSMSVKPALCLRILLTESSIANL
jgi:hypothetical protein